MIISSSSRSIKSRLFMKVTPQAIDRVFGRGFPATMRPPIHTLVVLLCIYFSTALPIPAQFPLYGGTTNSTTFSRSSVQILAQQTLAIKKHEDVRRPTFTEYTHHLRAGLHCIGADYEQHCIDGHRIDPTPKSTPSSATKDHSYGVLLGKSLSSKEQNTTSTNASASTSARGNANANANASGVTHGRHGLGPVPIMRRITQLRRVDIFDTLDRHGPECVALALFVLVPIAYLVLEMLDFAICTCIQERFPDRGRDRVRLLGPERQLRAWSNRQREKVLASEKRWWLMRRAR